MKYGFDKLKKSFKGVGKSFKGEGFGKSRLGFVLNKKKKTKKGKKYTYRIPKL